LQRLAPSSGIVSETQLELQDFLGLIPDGDGAGIIDPLNQEVGRNCVLVWAAVEHGDVRRTFDVVMVVQYLGNVGVGLMAGLAMTRKLVAVVRVLAFSSVSSDYRGDALLFN
jgi:hypothetical protein